MGVEIIDQIHRIAKTYFSLEFQMILNLMIRYRERKKIYSIREKQVKSIVVLQIEYTIVREKI